MGSQGEKKKKTYFHNVGAIASNLRFASLIERGEKTPTPKISALLRKQQAFTKGQFRPY